MHDWVAHSRCYTLLCCVGVQKIYANYASKEGAGLPDLNSALQQAQAAAAAAGGGDDDDEVPELVDNFEDVSNKESAA